MKTHGLVLIFALFTGIAAAQSLTCTNEAGYKPAEGMKAEVKEGMVTLTWPGEDGATLRASFDIENGTPMVKELAVRQGAAWTVLAKNVVPDFQVTTGKRTHFAVTANATHCARQRFSRGRGPAPSGTPSGTRR